MKQQVVCFLIVGLAFVALSASEPVTVAGGKLTIPIEYSTDGENWFFRGSVSVRTANANTAAESDSLTKLAKLTQSAKPELAILKAERYWLRVETTEGMYVETSVPTCMLAASNFEDHISIHLEAPSQVVAINYATRSSECVKSATTKPSQFTTRVTVSVPTDGAKPRMEMMPRPVPQEAQQQQQEGSWFSRYWYYILPIPIILIASSFFAPPEEAAGQGRSNGAGGNRARS